MRTDLTLNYLALENISERISFYYNALSDVEDALKSMKNFLEEQKSEAVSELKSKLEDVLLAVDKKKDLLRQLEDILNSYITDMQAFVDAAYEGVQTRVDTWNIGYNFMQLETVLDEFALKQSYSIPGECSIINEDNETDAVRQKLERNYNKVDCFRSEQMLPLAKRLRKQSEQIRFIKEKYVNSFEITDNEYRSRINKIYKECINREEKRENFFNSFAAITGVFPKKNIATFVAAQDVNLRLDSPRLAEILNVGSGCAVMVAMPERNISGFILSDPQNKTFNIEAYSV